MLLSKKDVSKDDIAKAMKAADNARNNFLEGENKKSDQQILAMALMMFYNDVDKTQHPAGFYENLFLSATSIDENPYKKYAASMFLKIQWLLMILNGKHL